MASRLSPPVRVLLLGAGPGIALTCLFQAGAIGDSAFQAGLTVLFLLGAGLVLARGALRSSSRRGWIVLGLALVAGMTGNALTGWAELGLDVPELVGIALGARRSCSASRAWRSCSPTARAGCRSAPRWTA